MFLCFIAPTRGKKNTNTNKLQTYNKFVFFFFPTHSIIYITVVPYSVDTCARLLLHDYYYLNCTIIQQTYYHRVPPRCYCVMAHNRFTTGRFRYDDAGVNTFRYICCRWKRRISLMENNAPAPLRPPSGRRQLFYCYVMYNVCRAL